jgi:glucose-1-phosphate cytidylyltransferase
MKVVILAGGYGTRIRDVSSDIPKPMIPIGNYPILWHIMKQFSHYNMNKFILCLGYKAEIIKDYFVNYQKRNNDFTLDLKTKNIEDHTCRAIEEWQITFCETGLHTLTGGRLFKVRRYLEEDEYFILTYGDGVSNISITDLIAFHKSHGKLMTVTGARPPARFGELTLDGNQVVGFNEKPQATEGWISAGFFVCHRKVLDYLSADEALIFEKGPIEKIVQEGQLMVYQHKDFWHPMDNSRDYHLLNDLWNQNKALWKIWA